MLSEAGLESSSDLFSRREDAVARGVGVASDRFVDRAEGAELWDIEGRRYIDFAAGIAVLNTGHRHPRVIAAVQEQLGRVTHTCFQVMPYDGYVRLAERLNAMAPIAGPAKSILLTTGAEAVENALKIARYSTGRRGIISFSGSFHGRTLIGMALTGKVTPYKTGFGPLPGDIYHLPFPEGGDDEAIALAAGALDHLFATTISPTDVAAIIVEPVQGEGGCHVAPAALLRLLRSACDRYGILLIDDEIQAGMGRTGSMFAIEPSGVAADIVTVAKGLAGGFPLAGVIARADVMDAVHPGGLGGTFAGSPISCAAALAVLDVIEDEGLVARAAAIGKRLSERIRLFHSRNDLLPISLPRGRGAMQAFDVLVERGSSTGDPALAKAVSRMALENGLIVLTCDKAGQAIRMLPPLNASDQIIDEGLDRLEQAFLQVMA